MTQLEATISIMKTKTNLNMIRYNMTRPQALGHAFGQMDKDTNYEMTPVLIEASFQLAS